MRADADIRLRLLQTVSIEIKVVPNLLSINSAVHAMESRNLGFGRKVLIAHRGRGLTRIRSNYWVFQEKDANFGSNQVVGAPRTSCASRIRTDPPSRGFSATSGGRL